MELGRRVRELRIRQGHTQENLAGLAGIHVTYVSGIERGVRNPSLRSIRALALALGVPVGELFPPDNNAPPPRSLAPIHRKDECGGVVRG